MAGDLIPATRPGWGERARPFAELVREAEAVKALGLDRDRSIDLLVDRLGRLGRHHAGTYPEAAKRAATGADDLPACPREVGTAAAAKVLGVSKDTVLKLREAGVLPYRNAAPPGSSRPVFRFPLEAVLKVRNNYQTETPGRQVLKEPPRRHERGVKKYKHLSLDDD